MTIHLTNKKRLVVVDLCFILLAFFYYLFFVNKGLVLADEGYYVHYAERIANGQIAYKDFLLQYSPGYFYLLAGLYKIFGMQILVGRFLSLSICLLILASVLALLHVQKITSVKIHILVALTVISLGYPLLHIPLVIWPCVLFAVLLDITYLLWLQKNKTRYLLVLGLLLALTLFFRQNIGVVFFIVINAIVVLSKKGTVMEILKRLLSINSVFAVFTSLWIYLFFIATNNLSGIITFFAYNKQFISTYHFSYPPLTYLLQPTGFFKLLPYYYPIIVGLSIVVTIIKRKVNWEQLPFVCIALAGFFTTVYPASDLLHVYPFLSLCIVSSLLFFYKKKAYPLIISVMIIFILLGVYLTFFTQSFRYEEYFLRETYGLHLPKTKGILVDKSDYTRPSLVPLTRFINSHTKKNDYIFVYPFAPMLYFVLDRQNPNGIVQFILLEAPNEIYSEDKVLQEIKQHHVKYVIVAGGYKYDRKISKFIQQQKEVYKVGPYIVFEIKK